jgi:hypothetical protein
MKEPIPLLLVVAFVVTGIYLVAGHLLQEGLRKKFPELYDKLGKPHIFMNNTPRNSVLVTKWLWNGDITGLGPSELLLYWVVRCTGVIAVICFFIGAFGVLQGQFK